MKTKNNSHLSRNLPLTHITFYVTFEDMQTTESNMTTLSKEHSSSAAYWGENGHWLIACAMTRDSDALGRSNFRCFAASLKALPEVKEWQGEFSPVTIERSSHWACGWVDYLVIDPECGAAVALADELRGKLEDYPMLDESDWSEEESKEADETWRNCYNERERVAYMREHRSQFEFHSFSDLLSCIRGKYFAGYASELIH